MKTSSRFKYKKGDTLYEPESDCLIIINSRWKDCRTTCHFKEDGYDGDMYSCLVLRDKKLPYKLYGHITSCNRDDNKKRMIAKDIIENKFIFSKGAKVLYGPK
jgi:hypothetical protein